MTLLIACILIYHFQMSWWWYCIAAAVWSLFILYNEYRAVTVAKEIDNRLNGVEESIKNIIAG